MKKTIKEEIKTKEKGTSKAFSVYMKIEVHNKIKMYKQAHGTKSVNEAIEELVEKGLEYSSKTEEKYINVLTDLREQSKFEKEQMIEIITLLKEQNSKLLKETYGIKAMLNKGLSAIYGKCGPIYSYFYEKEIEERNVEMTNYLSEVHTSYERDMPKILRGTES